MPFSRYFAFALRYRSGYRGDPVSYTHLGAVLVVLVLTVFLFGIEEGLEPIGQFAGRAITHTGSYPIVITASLILGFFISFAEPDLHILAKQVDAVTSGLLNRWILVIAVSIGIGVMMTVSMLRILHTCLLYTSRCV